MSEQATVATPAKAKPEVRTVTMTDGRKVDFAGKRKMLKEIVVDGKSVAVRFDWDSGETRVFPVPPQHLLYSAGHGYAQKLGDSVAGLKDNDGQPADADDQLLEIEQLHERLNGSEDWKVTAEGGSAGGGSVIIQAIAESTGKTVDQVKQFISAKLTEAEAKGQTLTKQALYASFRNSEKLRPIIRRLEDEKASKRKHLINADDMLNEITV